MPKFNYAQHKNINLSLQDSHTESEERTLNGLLSKDHAESKEEITEKKLESTRSKEKEFITEKRLNDNKNQRDKQGSEGDIPKLEEQRLQKDYVNEKAKGTSQKIKSKEKAWWNVKSEDGLKLASKKVVAKSVGEWDFYIQPITNILSAKVKLETGTDINSAIVEANLWLSKGGYNVSITEDNIDELAFKNNVLKFLVQIPELNKVANKKKV